MLDQEKEGQGQGLFASLLHVITMKSNCDIWSMESQTLIHSSSSNQFVCQCSLCCFSMVLFEEC
jgi:hypothetical protein